LLKQDFHAVFLLLNDICQIILKKIFLLFVITLLSANSAFAQLDNAIFKDSTFYPNQALNGNHLGMELSPFFKNNEYFHANQDGQTYIGYQLQGVFLKNIGDKTLLTLGGLAVQNYGNHAGFSKVLPIVSLSYFQKRSVFMAGTLKGAAHHNLIEPLYAQELFYTHRNENGFQWLYQGLKTNVDAWINWEINTDINIDRQEQFSSGLNLYKVYRLNSHQYLKPSAQLLYQHRGPSNGASVEPLKTIANGAIGLEYKYAKNKFNIAVKSYLLYYQDFSITKTNSFNDGYAQYHQLQISPNNRFDFIVNYWNGTEYQAAKGGAIYQSVNPNDRRYPERKKQLVFIRLHYHFMLDKNLMLDARLEPYYDLNQKLAESSYSLNLRYSILTKATGLKRN